MRSLRELLRHYDVVNDPARPDHALRFGALLVLAIVGSAILVFTAGSGPDRIDPDVASMDGGEAAGTGAGTEDGASRMLVEPRGTGWYLGYAEGTPPEQVDAQALEDGLVDWLDTHDGFLPHPVSRSGVVYGYELRPLT